VIDEGFANAIDDAYRRGDWDRLFSVLAVCRDSLEDDVAVDCVGWCVDTERRPLYAHRGVCFWSFFDPEYAPDNVRKVVAGYVTGAGSWFSPDYPSPTDAYVALIDGWKRAVADGVSVDELRGRVGAVSDPDPCRDTGSG
jgi:hypothetical protein